MFGIKLFFYDLDQILQLSEFVWTLRSSVWAIFNNYLLIDATDRSKISSDHHWIFFDVNLYPLSFFANTPFNVGSILYRDLLESSSELICNDKTISFLTKERYQVIYIYILCLSVCFFYLFVSNKRQNAEPIQSDFCTKHIHRWSNLN